MPASGIDFSATFILVLGLSAGTTASTGATCFVSGTALRCASAISQSTAFKILAPASGSGVSPTQSTVALDPSGFGIILNVPNSVAVLSSTPIDFLVDSRFNEATLITQCSIIQSTTNNPKTISCDVPAGSSTEIKVASFRSKLVKVNPDATMVG
ncbi:hypothetical protein HK096_006078 [Nowakowskiella sp. JEL0078]|nr:hypothetical protein HK096_006078 [Nowakowskiella sp. JEL0078]